jgi:hypothetical protein
MKKHKLYFKTFPFCFFVLSLILFPTNSFAQKALPWIPLLLLSGDIEKDPEPGGWAGRADFGQLEFVVNPTSTSISVITIFYEDFVCGPIIQNGRVTIGGSFDIVDRQFIIELSLEHLTINGIFEENGMHAYGTWEAIRSYETCNGTWEASPLNSEVH